MTVQPIASKSVLASQDYYRFKKVIDSQFPNTDDSGAATVAAFDISTKAIAVGPDSSFERYIVYYYDPANNLSVELGFVSADRPWVGRLDAFPFLSKGNNSSRGKIYVAAANNFSLADNVIGFGPIVDMFFSPTFDVIAYTIDQIASLSTQGRAVDIIDTALYVETKGLFQTTGVFFPFYGRKSFDLDLYGEDVGFVLPIPGLSYKVNGFNIGDLGISYTTELKASAPVNQERFHYDTSSKGCFDYIQLEFIGIDTVFNDPQNFDHGGLRALFKSA